MEKTANEAFKLTEAATGRHHIGDFLPPEELTKFMAKVTFFVGSKENEMFFKQFTQNAELNLVE